MNPLTYHTPAPGFASRQDVNRASYPYPTEEEDEKTKSDEAAWRWDEVFFKKKMNGDQSVNSGDIYIYISYIYISSYIYHIYICSNIIYIYIHDIYIMNWWFWISKMYIWFSCSREIRLFSPSHCSGGESTGDVGETQEARRPARP